MERSDWTLVAHGDMDVMNPIPAAKLDEVVGVLDLAPGARVLDLGCGRGDLLRRIASRYAIEGVGVDLLQAARFDDGGITFVQADFDSFRTDEPFDLVCGVGAAPLGVLRRHVRTGGLILYGEGYWRQRPSADYLDALDATEDELTDYDTLAASDGLLWAATASVEDFDRYEDGWAANGERYAAEHPGEPGVEEFLAWIRNGRRRYVELGGRETLGFGLFLFRAA